jgi:hypothetical protein
MITVFTTAKNFVGVDERNQRTALENWKANRLISEIILYGKSKGAEDLCRRLGITYVPDVPTTDLGTPYLDSMYEDARQRCQTSWIGYINCDIILPHTFEKMFHQLDQLRNQKLLVLGGRQNFDWPEDMHFSSLDEIESHATKTGSPDWPHGTDYFFHPIQVHIPFPKFAIGRPYWDNWLMHFGISSHGDVIDVTSSMKVLHPNHDYQHVPQRTGNKWDGPEGNSNLLMLADSFGEVLKLSDIKLELRDGQIFCRYTWFQYWVSNRAFIRRRITTLSYKNILIQAHDVVRPVLGFLARYFQALLTLLLLVKGIMNQGDRRKP